MKLKFCTALLAVATIVAPLSVMAEKAQDPAAVKRAAVAMYGKLPLSFETMETMEPTENSAHFLARSGSYAVSIGTRESSVAVSDAKSGKHQTLHFVFEHANPAASLEALEQQPGVTNYYRGKDASQWRLGVKSYGKLRAKSVYPGVDVIYYGDHRRLEFDFVVAPKADPGVIALSFSGMDKLSKDGSGDLIAEIGGQPVRFAKPYAYQKVGGVSKAVIADYVLSAGGKVRLQLGDYDHDAELIVDPVVSYATYLGGSSLDVGNGIAVDSTGAVYVTGQTCSSNFPDSPNYSGDYFVPASHCDAYVTKMATTFNAAGLALSTVPEYTVILGGANPGYASASGNAIALDSNNQAYIAGTTNIEDLPLAPKATNPLSSPNSYQGGDSDAFIAIVSAGGTLVRTSYLGGSVADAGSGIAVDRTTAANGGPNVIVVGTTCSQDFPGYGAFETKIEACAAFITELDNKLDIGSQINGTMPWGTSAMSPAPPSVAGGPYYYFSEFYNGQPVAPWSTAGAWNTSATFPIGAIVVNPGGDAELLVQANGFVSNGYSYCTTTLTANYRPTGNPPVPNWSATVFGNTLDNSCVWENMGPVAIPIYATTEAYGVALDPPGDVFIAGGTNTASLAPHSMLVGTGAWVLKVLGGETVSNNAPGTYVYGTALETTPTDLNLTVDTARAIAVDSQGQAYVTGTASGTLVMGKAKPYQAANNGIANAFLVKMPIGGNGIDYSTYLGGSGYDQGLSVAVDANFSPYVSGGATSLDFPTINPLTNPNNGNQIPLSGTENAFVTKFTSNGSALIFSAYMGGSEADQGNAIAVAPDLTISGCHPLTSPSFCPYTDMYVAGNSTSPDLLLTLLKQPMTAPNYGPLQPTNAGNGDAFVAMIPGSSIPTVTVTPGSLAFGNWNVGTTSASQVITYRNTSTLSSVQINSTAGIVFSNPQFQQIPGNGAPGTPQDCSPGLVVPATDPLVPLSGTCQILVIFTPSAQTLQGGTLTIADDASSVPHIVNLSGEGAVPTDTFSPSNLSFPLPPLTAQGVYNSSVLQSVTVTNTSGTGTLFVSNVAVAGINPGDFSESDNCRPSVPPSSLSTNPPTWSTCTINVTFTPGAAGARSATVLVSDNASATPQQINLSGNGRLVASTVTTNPSTAPLALNFPQQGTNVASVPQTVTVKNTDLTQSLLVDLPTITGDYQVSTDTCKESLLPGASCIIQVVFLPPAPGTLNGTLTITGNGTAMSPAATVTLTGTAGADTTLLPAAVTFSSTNLGVTSPSKLVTLTNKSLFAFNMQSVVISGPAAGDFLQTNNCGTSVSGTSALAPAVPNCTISVSFTPTTSGNRDATLTVTSGATASPQSVSITGYGIAPLVTLSLPPATNPLVPATILTFANPQPLNAAISASILLTNSGGAPLNIPTGGITIAGTAASDFSQTNNCGTQVAAGGSCTINVVFTPTASNSRGATLSIADNAVPNPQTIQLLGSGVQVQAPSAPATLTFTPNQALNASGAKTVMITNTDPKYPLTLNPLPVATGDFMVVPGGCGGTVPKGSGCLVGVTFTPTASGTRTGTLTVANNGSATPLTVALTGTGGADASVNTTSINLSANVNESSAVQVTLINHSTFPANLTGVSISSSASQFALAAAPTNKCGATVPASGSCNVGVIFNPTASGVQTATLTIASDAATPFAPVTLTGTGTSPAVSLSTLSLSFPGQALKTTSGALPITLNNTGNGPLTVGAVTITGTAAGDFKSSKCGQVAAGGSCVVNVTFTPTALNTRSAVLTFTDDAASSPQTVALSGTGGGTATLCAGAKPCPVPPSPPVPVMFAGTNVGATSPALAVTLTNQSSFPLNVQSVAIGGVAASEFSQTNNCGTSVSGTSAPALAVPYCTINVSFTPTSTGYQNAILTVTSDAAASPQSVAIKGYGTAPLVTLAPAVSLPFGNQPLNGAPDVLSITLTNSGLGPLNIPVGGITIGGAVPGDFSQTNTCGTQVLPNGGKCAISVTFAPSALYSRTATLNIADDALPNPQIIQLSGTGWQVLAPTATPSSLTFANQALNIASGAQTVTIQNTDKAYPLSLTSIGATGDFQIQPGGCGAAGATLAPSSKCGISVTFTPSASGTRTGTLTVVSNGSSAPLTVPLSGTGGAAASVNPTWLDLGSVNVGGSSAAKLVTLSNSSAFAVNISGVSMSGFSAGQFSEINNCGTIVPAWGKCTVSVTFCPTATGTQTAKMTIASDAATPFTPVSLTGNGTTPVVSLSPASLNFQSQVLHIASATMPVTLSNTGTGPLNLSTGTAIAISAGDFAQTNTCGMQVAAGSSCVINVTFTPTALNSRTAAITITDDAADSPQTVPLTGSGVAGFLLSPASVSFGSQQVGTTSLAQTVTLTNSSSTTALAISKIVITGTNGSDFGSPSTTCPANGASLAAASSCTISVKFTPSKAADESATLTVTGSGSNSPTVALIGTGTTAPTSTPPVDVTPQATGVSITQGGTATYTFNVAPLNGYSGSISFTCSGPNGSSCSISPNPWTMDGTSTKTVIVSVNTSGGNGTTAKSMGGTKPIFLALLPFSMMGMLFISKRRGGWLVLVLVGLCLLLGLAGCGAGTASSTKGGVAPGTYQVTVTPSANGTAMTPISLSLVVNPQ